MPGDEELFQKDFELELSKFRSKTKPTLAEAIVKLWGDVSFEKKEFPRAQGQVLSALRTTQFPAMNRLLRPREIADHPTV
jgi:hypothetical protein